MFIGLLIIAEIILATFAVHKYWKFRIREMGEKESNMLMQIGLIAFTAIAFNFMNFLAVVIVTVIIVEAIRSNLISKIVEKEAQAEIAGTKQKTKI